MQDNIKKFISLVAESMGNYTFVKLSLGNHKGEDKTLKNLYAKKITIKNQEKIQFVFRHQTKDITKNYDTRDALSILQTLVGNDFYAATLFTLQSDYVLQVISPSKSSLITQKPTHTSLPDTNHDKKKNYTLDTPANSYLHDLKITDNKGNVLVNSQDKYKQINHYVELLSPMFKDIDATHTLKIADMGSGKGYLTFALYDYIKNKLRLNAEVTGVELRKELVELCNTIAAKNNFKSLRFIQGAIHTFDFNGMDVLIALHACDTATDDAIASGIKANAKYIVVAPCCHKQIRREIEKNKPENDFSFMAKHGVFLERHAEMLTDAIRALILEYYGYKTKVFEFISDVHTPKNVMIMAEKRPNAMKDEKIKLQLQQIKKYFGIGTHYLETLLDK